MAEHYYEILLAIGVVSPFVGFWTLVFFGPKLGKPLSGWFAVVVGMGVPLVMASMVLVGWLGEDPASREYLTAHAVRFAVGDVRFGAGDHWCQARFADHRHVRHGDVLSRFGSLCSALGTWPGTAMKWPAKESTGGSSPTCAFLASPCWASWLAVASCSCFIFWELVGLCSYLLIGFYFDKGFCLGGGDEGFHHQPRRRLRLF